MYQPRTYRNLIKAQDLVPFTVEVLETDLYIRAWQNLSEEAEKCVRRSRGDLEDYISRRPEFKTSLTPLHVPRDSASIVREMAEASARVGVGPMAAVAGAIAEAVGRELLPCSPEVIVENGGDIFLSTRTQRRIAIYAGNSPLSYKIAIEVAPEASPLGACTSSGTVGHSLSFGNADAVTVLSHSTALADAAATAIGNLIQREKDIPKGLEFAKEIGGLRGVVIIKGEKMGVWGDVSLCKPPAALAELRECHG